MNTASETNIQIILVMSTRQDNDFHKIVRIIKLQPA